LKKICAITMARNDNFFLERWINYYSKQLGKENLFVILDGLEQVEPVNADGVSITKVEHITISQRSKQDSARAKMLSDLASKLLEKYDLVIGGDVDEFLIVDPDVANGLKEYLNNKTITTPTSGLGIDIGQKIDEEPPIDKNKLFLQQRKYAVVSSRYTKPILIAKKMRWGGGMHRVRNKNFTIDENLFLFHFGMCDENMLKSKLSTDNPSALGWENHIKRRLKTIHLIKKLKAKDFDQNIPKARFIQKYFRSLYAWNKPSMYFWRLVVKIPSKFSSIV